MVLPYTVITMLVVLCLLISSGYPIGTALYKAMRPQDWDSVISKLPLSDHALKAHQGQNINAVLLQMWLEHKTCFPRKFYVGCNDGQRLMFTCKANPTKVESLWVVAIIATPWGLGVEDGRIVTVYGKKEHELDSVAKNHGCLLPAIPMP